jgi:hypothetical protein
MCPGERWRAAERVQIVHQNLLHPEVSQPFHVRGDLCRYVLGKSGNLKEKNTKFVSYDPSDI